MSTEKYTTTNGTRWMVRYTTPEGKRSKKRGFRTKTEALQWQAAYTLGEARHITGGERPLRHYADAYRQEIRHLRPTTVDVYEICLSRHVIPRWGGRKPSTITTIEVQQWVNDCDFSRSQAERNLRILRRLCKLAGANDPTADIAKPRRQETERHYLTPAQVHALAQASDYPTAVYVLATVGLRWGEMSALTVADFNHTKRTLRVNKNYATVRGRPVLGPPKSGKARTVSVPAFVADMLADTAKGRAKSAPLLPSKTGEPMRLPKGSAGWFASALRRCQAADDSFPRIRIHDLRHTAASIMVAGGAHVKVVQAQLGHAQASMTLDVYADLFPEDLASVAATVDAAMMGAHDVPTPP